MAPAHPRRAAPRAAPVRADRPADTARLDRLLWRRAIGLWCVLSLVGASLAVGGERLLSQDQVERRVRAISEEVRCPACEAASGQSAGAGSLAQWHLEIREQVERGRSDSEVVAHLVARYGDFVRYRPAMNASAVLLGAALATLGLLWVRWRWRRDRTARTRPPERLAGTAGDSRGEVL